MLIDTPDNRKWLEATARDGKARRLPINTYPRRLARALLDAWDRIAEAKARVGTAEQVGIKEISRLREELTIRIGNHNGAYAAYTKTFHRLAEAERLLREYAEAPHERTHPSNDEPGYTVRIWGTTRADTLAFLMEAK
jgi:hypothetical protein